MDKQNYTLRELEIQVLKKNFSHLKVKLSKELEDRILKRKRVLKSLDLLMKAIFLFITEQLSFQRLSDRMASLYGVVMSDTAWRKQILKAAPILLEWVLAQQGIEESKHSGNAVLGCTSVYAVDATDLPVQGGDATSRRVHTVFSICERRCVYTDVTDRHGGESLTRFSLRRGALYFADRAYGRTPQLAYAMEQQAHVVTRIAPQHVAFYTAPDCRKKNLVSLSVEGRNLFHSGLFQAESKGLSYPSVGRKAAGRKACGGGKTPSPKGKPQSTQAFKRYPGVCSLGLPGHYAPGHLL